MEHPNPAEESGGMGFKDFPHHNMANFAKQAWRLLTEPNTLWEKVLKAIYFPNLSFLEITFMPNSSWMRRSLLEGKEFLKRNYRWGIGTGDNI